MAISISGLTEVVNKYLNSISDSGKAVKEVNEAVENRRVFRDTLGEAIKAEIAGKIPEFPDIPSVIQQNMENRMRVDTTFQAEKAAETSAVSETAGTAAGVSSADSVKELVKAITSSNLDSNTNADAFKGQLSAEALQELAKSAYFSGNLIQGNLFSESTEGSSSSLSSGSGSSLSELNAKSLLAAYLNKGTDINTSVFGDFSL